MDADLLWTIILPLFGLGLWHVQRRSFWALERAGGSRRLAYLLIAPSTIAHELSHYAAALCLGVPAGKRAGGKVELFHPRSAPGGGIRLGAVSVANSDPFRASLISIAPVLLVPLMLVGLNQLLLDRALPTDAVSQLASVAPWRVGLWLIATLLLPLGAFPSPGDHIGVGGAIALLATAGGTAAILYSSGGSALVLEVLAGWSQILALPAIAGVALTELVARRSRRRRVRA